MRNPFEDPDAHYLVIVNDGASTRCGPYSPTCPSAGAPPTARLPGRSVWTT